MDWPSCEATSDIPAGMPLLCDYGDDYWDVVPQRRRVFAAVVLQTWAMGELRDIGAAVEVCEQVRVSSAALAESRFPPLLLQARFLDGRRGVDWRMWSPLVSAAQRVAPLIAAAAAPPRLTLASVEAAQEDLCSEPTLRALPKEHVALTPAARRAMFCFPAVTSAARGSRRGSRILPPGLRYRPEDVPLASIETTELVGVFRDSHGDLYAYARVVIPRGTLIGWYVGALSLFSCLSASAHFSLLLDAVLTGWGANFFPTTGCLIGTRTPAMQA